MLDYFERAAPIAAPLCSKFSAGLDIDSPSDLRTGADLAFAMATETLALMGSPALVFDETGKALFANRLIEKLTAYLRLRAHNSVSFKDAAAQARFREAAAALGFMRDPPMRAFAVPGSATGEAMIARILPIRSMPGVAMLVLTPLARPEAPPVQLMQSLFNLTPAEARVAGRMTAGATVEDLAVAGCVSRNTVRSQLRVIMAKTGCHRQAEAVGLFSMVSVAGKITDAAALE
jgi:DNA-binding CsgD family transcriptional regulator